MARLSRVVVKERIRERLLDIIVDWQADIDDAEELTDMLTDEVFNVLSETDTSDVFLEMETEEA